MQKSNKLMIGFVVLAMIIAFGMYLNRRHRPRTIQPSEAPNVAAQNTNRPSVHIQRPTVVAQSDPLTELSDSTKLPRDKVEEYVRQHNRNLTSLLAAFHALQDTNYLLEAATNFPNDPRVQWTVLARNVFPEDRRKWLDNFKTSSPSNSLANYLSARDYFKNNQPDAAIKELLAASTKSQFTDYSTETLVDGDALGQFSGISALETHLASTAAMAGDLQPELANLKGVVNGIQEAQKQYVASGDATSAQNLAQAGVMLANRLTTGDGGKFIINQLVGIASETVVLQNLDQNTSYDFLNGETPAQRLADLKQQKSAIRDLMQNHETAVLNLSEDQLANYWDRTKIYGELEANRWLQQQHVTPNSGN